jgi:translocation and assembly module TamB
VSGPLAGGAAITGRIDLGTVDVQVPSTGVSVLGSLPAVTHLGIPTRVAQILARADIGTTPDAAGGTSSSGPAYPIDLTVNAPSRIFVRGRGLDAELGGQLRLTGTTNAIIPIGRFDLVRGRLSILGQRFDLDEGYAQLQGDFSPFLRLVATTETSNGTLVRIVVEGPANDIEVRFESTPELPQDEVLAQLLFGRDLSSISPLQAVQLASAVATLAGSSGGGVVDRLRQGLDLDDLDFVTDEDGNAAVRAGKYISDRVYTDITVGVGGTSEINLNIDIDRNITARGSVASDGETSVGIFFERDY